MSFPTLLNFAETAAQPEAQPFNWGTLLIFGLLAAFLVFMFTSGRKRQKEAQSLQDNIQIGTEIMTSFGVYGTIKAINEDDSIMLETSPKTVLKVHRQAVGRIIEPEVVEAAETETDSDSDKK